MSVRRFSSSSVVGGLLAIVVVVAIGLFALLTEPGASLLAGLRCTPSWLTADRASFQACYDVEREQIVEERAKRHTQFDE